MKGLSFESKIEIKRCVPGEIFLENIAKIQAINPVVCHKSEQRSTRFSSFFKKTEKNLALSNCVFVMESPDFRELSFAWVSHGIS